MRSASQCLMEIKYPKGEVHKVNYLDADGAPIFILTGKEALGLYYLYEVQKDGGLKKLGKAKTPTELEQKFRVWEKMRKGL